LPFAGYVDPFFLDQDTDEQPISESCSAVSDPSPLSVHTHSTVGYGANVDLDSVDGQMSVFEYVKHDGSSSRPAEQLYGAETGNISIENSRLQSTSPSQEGEISRIYCDVSKCDSMFSKENGPDFAWRERQIQGATLATESRDFAEESGLTLSVAVASDQSEARTASQMSSSGDDAEVKSADVEIALQDPVGTESFSAISVAEVDSDRACENEDTPINGSGPIDQVFGGCTFSGEVVACEGNFISEPVHDREAVEVEAEFRVVSSGEAEYLPPWLRDQVDGLKTDPGDPADKVTSAGLDAFHQQLHGPSEALSPSDGFSSCCVPWLKEEWNVQVNLPAIFWLKFNPAVINQAADGHCPTVWKISKLKLCFFEDAMTSAASC
jgi:hypothetical protein